MSSREEVSRFGFNVARWLKTIFYVGAFFVLSFWLYASSPLGEVNKAQAAACSSVAGTVNWSSSASWTSCNSTTPQSGDTVTIIAGSTVTVDSGNPTVTSISIASPTTANGISINTGQTLTTTGTFAFTANATANAQTVTLNGTGNFTVGTSITIPAVTAASGVSRIVCAGSATGTLTAGTTISITGSSTTNGGASSIDMSGGACNITTGNSTTTLTGGSATNGQALLRIGTGTITFNGSLAFGGSQSGKSQFITANGSTVVLNGASLPVVGSSGAYTITASTNLTSTGTSSVAYATAVTTWGALNVNSGTLTFNGANGTFTSITIANGAVLSSNKTLTISLSSGSYTNNGTHSGTSGALTISGASATIAGSGTTSITGTITFGASAATPTLSLGASLTLNNLTIAVNTTLTVNGTLTITNNLVFTAPGASQNTTLTQGSSSVVNVGGTATLTMAGSSTGSPTTTWNINAGTATVTGEIVFTGTTSGRTKRIIITSGTLNANGGIDNGGSGGANTIDMSGGAGTLNLKGGIQVGNVAGGTSWTFTMGTSGSNFVYNDTVAQTVYFPASGAYNNLIIKTTATATLAAAVTSSNVTGNLVVGDDSVAAIFDNGGFAITGGSGDSFIVNDLARFEMSGTSTYPTAFTTFTYDSNSTVDYEQTGSMNLATATYGNLVLSPASGTPTFTLVGNTTVAGTLDITGGTLDQGASFNLTTGAVTVGASGIWTNTGTGDVTLSGGVSNAGTITLDSNGSGCGGSDDIVLTSSNTSQRTWSGAGTFTLRDLIVSYMAGSMTAYGTTDSGNNAWTIFSGCGITVSGTIYSDEGSTPIASGPTVRLKLNGSGEYTATANGSGVYSISTVLVASAGDVLTVFIDGATPDAVAVTRAADTTTNITGFNLYQNVVILRHENGSAITNTNLDQYDSGNDADIGFTVSSSNLTVSDGFKLMIWTGKTFTPGGTITTSPSSSSASADGDIMIQSGATLSMGSNALSVGGDFSNIGTYSKSSGQTVTLTATATGHSINLGTGNLDNLTLNGSGGGWTFSDSSNTIDGDLTATAGTLSGTSSLTVSGGDVTGNGTINFTGGTILVDGTGNFGGNTSWNFNDLTFGDGTGSATTSATGSGEVVVTGAITIATNQTLSAGSKNFELQAAGGTTGGWWNGSWLNRRKITLNNSASSENLVNFPILVALSASNIDYSKTQNSGQDIRFVDADGTTQLSHEIETWNESGTSYVWVKIPQIDSGSTTDYIWVYYNNGGASDGQNATGVWNSDYVGVWHMNSSGTNVPDSTNTHNGTKTDATHPTTSSSGKISDAQSFTADQSPENRLTLSAGSHSVFTGEFWLRHTQTDTYGSLLSDISGGRPGVYYYNSSSKIGYYDGNSELFSNTTLSSATWYHITFVKNGSSISFYRNGAPDGTATDNGSSWSQTVIGADGVGNEELTGLLDEYRISSVARSAEWIEATYNWSNNPTGFNTFSSEESSFVPLFVTNGTFTSATSTFEFTSDSNMTIPDQSFYNLVLNNSGTTFTAPASGLAVGNNLTITAGTFDLNTNDLALTINNLTNDDTLSASASATLTITGNWTNNGTFTHNNGTVAFQPASTSAIISGGASTNVFYNFTSTNAGGKTLQFEAGDETKFEGTLTLMGTELGPLAIDSTTSTPWELWLTGSVVAQRLLIKNSGCYSGTNTVPAHDTNISQGNNGTCWILYVRGGGSSSGEGSGAGGSGATSGGGSSGGGDASGGGSGGEGSQGGGSSGGGGGEASP